VKRRAGFKMKKIKSERAQGEQLHGELTQTNGSHTAAKMSGEVLNEGVKLAESVRRLWDEWIERYILHEDEAGGIRTKELKSALFYWIKGMFMAALAFMFTLAPITGGAAAAIEARPMGFALLSAAGKFVPFIWSGVALGSLFTNGMALPGFLCSVFVFFIRVGIACWLKPSRGELRRQALNNIPYAEKESGGYFCEPIILRVGCSIAAALLMAVYRIVSGGFLYFDILSGLCELCCTPLMCLVFTGAFEPSKRYTSAYEVGMFGLMFSAVLAMKPYAPLGFSLSSVGAAIITMFVSKIGGILRGGVAGLVTGLAASPIYAPAFGLMGLASGVSHTFGAAASAALSSVVAMASGVALGGLTSLRLFAPDILASAVIFVPLSHFELLPKLHLYAESSLPASRTQAAVTALEAQKNTYDRLEAISDAMSDMSEVFYNLSDRLRRPGIDQMRRLCEDVFAEKCRGCCDYARCHEREYAETEEVMRELAVQMSKGDRLEVSRLPRHLAGRCKKLPAITDELNKRRGKVSEELLCRDSTRVFAMDYEAMSKLLEYAVEKNRTEYRCDTRLSGELTECARCVGLYASNIAAYGSRKKTVIAGGIDMTRANAGSEDIRKAFSNVCGLHMNMPEYSVDGEYVSMTLSTARSFKVEYARASDIASSEKDGDRISGDTITSFDNKEDYSYILISDGMGSGREAALTSRTAGIFLEKLLSSGNSKAVSLEMLNNFIRSKNMESFATIDLLEVDLVTGEGCFVKSGAAPSYILRGQDLFKIASNTMPIGITRELNAEEIHFTLKEGDIVVMVSDGVAQSFEDGVWLASMLAGEWDDTLSLSESAARILARAKGERRCRDDMTVGVAKICAASV